MSQEILSIFQVYPKPIHGQLYLKNDLSKPAYDARHNLLQIVGVIGVICFVFGKVGGQGMLRMAVNERCMHMLMHMH